MRHVAFASILTVVAGLASPVLAQSEGELPGWTKRLAIDPNSSAMQKYAQQQKARAAADKELRKLRLAHFGNIGNLATRQEGLVKLMEYTDPALFPLMVDIFGKEGPDVRDALLNHFYDSGTAEGDGSLAWMAMFGNDDSTRRLAKGFVEKRIDVTGSVPDQVKLTIAAALKSDEPEPMRAGLSLIRGLDLIEFIPWLIAGQVRQQGVQTGGTGSGGGDLAYIVVGTQTAFVSDLTPVVSQSAVGFDPQVSTITSGTILRIHEAVVYEYHTEINAALIDMTSRHMGASTRQLGWNVPAWREFYANEFLPKIAQEKAAKAAAKLEAERLAAGGQPSTTPDASGPK
ncbi:MAG: hypothetical protein WC718_13380 [Phycisphaerales bacterium]|jgi:hypothetical protein